MAYWPEEHDQFLRTKLAAGLSSAKAAAELNARFGTAYTRNACIGRAVRQAMPRDHGKGPKQPAEPRPKRHRMRIVVKPVVVEKPRPAPVCVEIDPLHISLAELTEQTCHWPYGDSSPFTFCGHPVVFGSYCGPHYDLSRRAA